MILSFFVKLFACLYVTGVLFAGAILFTVLCFVVALVIMFAIVHLVWAVSRLCVFARRVYRSERRRLRRLGWAW